MNADKIEAVLASTQQFARRVYIDKETRARCSGGALAHAAGVADEVLAQASHGDVNDLRTMRALWHIEDVLLQHYGITKANLSDIFDANDNAAPDRIVVAVMTCVRSRIAARELQAVPL